MNKLMIIGNLVRDPEMRTTQSGINVCTFTVAVNRRQKGDSQATDYFRVTAWRQLGENCSRFLTKGRKVAVLGEVSVSTYTTQNGETRANLEVLAQDVEFLTPRAEQGETAPQSANSSMPDTSANQGIADGYFPVTEEDLPF